MGEKRHIKLSAELVPSDKTKMTITVLEQTHFLKNFGGNINGGHTFEYGGIKLWSDGGVPSYVSNWTCHLFLKGKENDPTEISRRVPSSLWPKIKEAVEYYNKLHGGY